ncbi:MAG: hypothetical protein HS127_10355 [Planctomycetia bacterium]|nr:hypothetical protein [Planctomycetia bacterium]
MIEEYMLARPDVYGFPVNKQFFNAAVIMRLSAKEKFLSYTMHGFMLLRIIGEDISSPLI